MFDQRNRGKIKNSEIQAWRAELGMFAYEVKHRSGNENVAADALSRVCSVAGRPSSLKGLHESLGHPGITRLWHFVLSKNLPFLLEVRQTCLNSHTCSVLKPRFYRPTQEHLVKATSAWETGLSVDFKGPIVTSPRGNRFLFVVVDEYSRFPFAFPCKDSSASSVVKCLSTLFSLFGFPFYVHSDRGTAFLCSRSKDYLHSRGIATSHSTPYHSTGNSQCERFNQTIWKTISLMIMGSNLGPHHWEGLRPKHCTR